MKKIYNLLAILTLPAILILYSYSSGSPGGKTGSIGDGGNTCTDCHTGTSQSQSDWISTNIPAQGFTPGETYTITATGMHSGVVKFGFELTAEDSFGDKVGTFTITEPTRTKQANANNAVTHTNGGTTPTGNSNSWTMDWTAPSSSPEVVKFYAAFNAADGNGSTNGDQIYTTELTVNQYQPMPQITGVDPDHAQQGFMGTLTITGENTEWTSGVDNVMFKYHDDNSVLFEATQIMVTGDNMLTADVDIPVNIAIGNYDVYVDDLVLENGFVVDIIDGLADNSLENEVSVFPNPAVNSVNITTPQGSTYIIHDISGRIIEINEASASKTIIDLTDYETGLYFIRVSHLDNNITKRLIVK